MAARPLRVLLLLHHHQAQMASVLNTAQNLGPHVSIASAQGTFLAPTASTATTPTTLTTTHVRTRQEEAAVVLLAEAPCRRNASISLGQALFLVVRSHVTTHLRVKVVVKMAVCGNPLCLWLEMAHQADSRDSLQFIVPLANPAPASLENAVLV